jgi:C_GCAxxG_C_C family probable redox protein
MDAKRSERVNRSEMDKPEEAKALFHSGANCAQAIVGTFHKECCLDYDTAMRLSSGFGAGMGRLREVCGAVSGMFMVASLKCGYSDLNDKNLKDKHYALIQKLAERFKSETGSIVCRELLGLPTEKTDSPVAEARTLEYYRKRPCVEMVALAARILDETLKE